MERVKHKIIFIMLFMMLFITPITSLKVYAEDASMTDEDAGPAGQVQGGPTSIRTGWLFYCIDLNNNQITSTEAIACGPLTIRDDVTPLREGNMLTLSRYNVRSSQKLGMTVGCSWGPPFAGENGAGRGEEVKRFMLEKADGKPRAYTLIKVNWGEDLAEKWLNKEIYLAIEPFYWNALHKDRASTGIWYAATSYWWGHLQGNVWQLPETGDPMLSKYTNGVYNYCVMLEDCEEIRDLGYKAPASGTWLRTNAEMHTPNIGNGIGIIWNEDQELIHTYWEPNGSPGDPEPVTPEKSGTMNIVKSYYTDINNGESYTNDGTYYTLMCSNNISIDEEPEYKIVSWKITNELNIRVQSTDGSKVTWNPPGTTLNSGTSPEIVKLKTPQKCVYVLLKRVEIKEEEQLDSNFVVTESVITRAVHLSKPDAQLSMPKIQDYEFTWTSPAHKNSCNGHTYTDDCGDEEHGCPGHESFCTWGQFIDSSLTFSLKNNQSSSYPDILATKSGWEKVTPLGGTVKLYRNITRNEVNDTAFKTKGWDYKCVLLRGKDKLTVANWKNNQLGASAANTDLSGVSSSGFVIANTDSGDRKTKDYYESFTASLADDSPDKDTTRIITADSGHGACGPDTQTSSLNSGLDVSVSVKLETYSGSADGGVNDTTCDSSIRKKLLLSSYNKSTGREMPSGGAISFRPYVQMNYDTYTSSEKQAYVLGEHQRELTPNDYAEISWNKKSIPNLTLNSLQWSTHASATDFIVDKFGYEGLKDHRVLPGGATLSLSIKRDNMQQIRLTTFQCVVLGSGKEQIETAGGSTGGLTEEQAIEAHKAYVLDVIETLEKVNVEQWVTTNVDSKNAWDSGSVVGPGISLKSAGHSGQKGSTESKYYLRGDGELPDAMISEGDLDVYPNPNRSAKESIEAVTTTVYYTFFTNTYGEVRYTVGDTSPNVGNERKGNLANDSIAKMINARTHIVDKLEAAVERGTGEDTSGRSKTGNAWYNEAFDGVTVMVQKTTLNVGFINPAERSTVLDPKLIQTHKGQSDMFNPDKYNMSQYRTKNYSDRYNEDNKVGAFKGVDIYTDEMNMLYWSEKFYIPNMTVQDLK